MRKFLKLSLPIQMAIAVTFFCFFQLLFSQRIPENAGLGWDGWTYAKWIRDFDWEVLTKGLDSYYIQRVLPPMMVRGVLLLFGLPLTDPNIVATYMVMNSLCLIGVAYLWGLIARRLKLTAALQWLGCLSLFLNFGIGYMAFFTPVLTDFISLLIGALQFYFALQGANIALLVISVVGAFVWPTAFVTGLLLFLFHDPKRKAGASPTKFRLDLPLIGPAIACLFFFYRYLHSWPRFEHSALNNINVLSFTLQLLVCSLCFSSQTSIRDLWDRIASKKLLIVIVLFAVVGTLRYYLSNHVTSALGYGAFLIQLLRHAMRFPFLAMVSHVVYFGPVLLIPLLRGRFFVREIHREDFGLFFLFISLIMLNTESRLAINFIPFIIAFSMKALEGANWGAWQFGFFTGVTFLFSKFWLRLASLWPTTSIQADAQREFPAQYYFMSFGPWMSFTSYCIQGAVVLVTLAALFLLFRRSRAISAL